MCSLDKSLDEMNFNLIQIWIQIYGLSIDMYNTENVYRIRNNVGKCIMVESEQSMHQRNFLRLKIEINVDEPLMDGFWWSNSLGQEKWEVIKYE